MFRIIFTIVCCLVTLQSHAADAQENGTALTNIRDISNGLDSQTWPVTNTKKLALRVSPSGMYAAKSALTATGEPDPSERANALFDATEKECFERQVAEFHAAFDKFELANDVLLKGFKNGKVYYFKVRLFDITAIGEDGLKKYPGNGAVGSDFLESNPPLFGPTAVAFLRKDSAGKVTCATASADSIFAELTKHFAAGN